MTDDFLDDYHRYLAGELTYEELHARERRRETDRRFEAARKRFHSVPSNVELLKELAKR